MTPEFDDEVLVAYLDGELDAEQTQQIDQQIATQAELRDRINQLRMTWDMLDDLPVAPPSPRFAETTLEMAALASVEEPKSVLKVALHWMFNNASRIFVISLPLFLLSGFAASSFVQSRAERQLLRDLPILVDWRALSNIDSLEWLEILVEQPDLVTAFQGTELSLVGNGEVPIQLNERRDWVTKFDDSARSRLRVNLTEFRQQEPSRQLALREFITKIYADPVTKERYLSAARCYELLLQQQSMTQRSTLYDLPLAERKSELVHLISVHRSQLFANEIPTEDAATIRKWAERMRSTYLIVHGKENDALRTVDMDLYINTVCPITFADFEDLASEMSDEARSILVGLNGTNSYVDTLVYWIHALTIPNDAAGDRIGAEKLRELYMNLTGSKQDQVDLLPPQEAKSLLLKLVKPRHQPTES
jgi:hypothetical protein